MIKRRKLSRRSRAVLALVGIAGTYVISYIALSAHGEWHWSQTGRLRYKTAGLAVTDVVRWFPAGAHWEQFKNLQGDDTSRGDLPGYFFSPLIRVDRAWAHPDRQLSELVGAEGGLRIY